MAAAFVHTAPRALLDHPVELARRLSGHGRTAVDAALSTGNALYRNEEGYVAQIARVRALLGSFGGEVPGLRLVGGYTAAFIDHEASRYAERMLYRRPEQTFRWLGIQRYLSLDRPLPERLSRHLEPLPFAPAPGVRLYRSAFDAPLVRCPGGAVPVEHPLAHLDGHPELRSDRLARTRAAVAVGGLLLPAEPKDSGARVSVLRSDPGRWRLHVATENPCLLVVAENHDPGWRASMDGEKVDIVKADAAFLATPVPPGEHDLRFEHRPLEPLLALAGLLAAAAAIMMLRRRPTRAPRA